MQATATTPKISWENFQQKYLSREDGYKYEWVNGQVVTTKHMDKTQFYILSNILEMFEKLLFAGKTTGRLIPEGDMFFAGNHRRPDVCYLTREQITRMADNSDDVPSFIIEIISNNDQMNTVRQKMADYRRAGVQCVWQVFPLMQEVHVYNGLGLRDMHVHEADEVCSAAPALPQFEMQAKQFFVK